jgi:tRNA A-37 threonylcarbamoyl transferase component Bud32
MNVGFIGTNSNKAPVLFGDALRTAERLVSLNHHCQSLILLPQQTFETVQGYFTAEIVDYVPHLRKEEIVTVYQLLGPNNNDPLSYGDRYKDAMINFSRHKFEEASKDAAFCREMAVEERIKFSKLRQLQCTRLQNLIARFRNLPAEEVDSILPNPYFRQWLGGWYSFDDDPRKPKQLRPPGVGTDRRFSEGGSSNKSNAVELESRAGMQTVTVECLTGMLQKESEADPDDDTESVLLSARARQVGGVAVPLLQGLKKRVGGNTMAIGTFPTHDLDIDPDDSDDSGTATVDDGDDTDHDGLSGDEAQTVAPSVADLLQTTSSIEGQTFKDISGRSWRCSTQCLGRGGFGAVYLGIDEQGKLVAIKEHILKCGTSTIKNKVTLNEIAMLWNLQHNNIVSYQGCAVVQSSLIIIMEYIACGSLETIVNTFGNIPEGTAVHYVRDIVRGLSYLHSHDVVHLDVKPANVLLDQQGRCKLADFGTAVALSDLMQSEVMGTPVYMAPERVTGDTSALSDIWSLGITLAEVLTGKKPFDKEYQAEAMLYGLYTKTIIPIIPDNLSLHASSFLQNCLAQDPAGRSSATELLGHPFLL